MLETKLTRLLAIGLLLLIIGCGIFVGRYKCDMYTGWWTSGDSEKVGTTKISGADNQQDAESQCMEENPGLSYCTCTKTGILN